MFYRAGSPRLNQDIGMSIHMQVIESYDGKFELAKDSEDALKQLLASPTFAKQVCNHASWASPCTSNIAHVRTQLLEGVRATVPSLHL